MSRQNKVNPGMYTQRGRLTQDDAARELKRQREVGSEHTWQPSKKDHFPRLTSHDNDAAPGAETSGDKEAEEARETAPTRTAPKQPARGKAKAARKTAKKRAAPKTVRKAVLARNVGGGAPKLRKPAARRKS